MTSGNSTSTSSSEDEYAHLAPLFDKLAEAKDEDERAKIRDELVTGYAPVAEHIAWRFANRGQPTEDLMQVATVGLINAVHRFDPTRGSDFLAFAIPTIMGEVRRHFRDNSWAVHVPRRLKELHLSINTATGELFQRFGRAPSPSELAEHLGIGKDEVYEGLEAGNAYYSVSVDQPSEDEGAARVVDYLGDEDPALEQVENHESLLPLIRALPERERRILTLRFYGNLTQTEIAEQVGLSQMHISRLLAKTLAQLRSGLEAD